MKRTNQGGSILGFVIVGAVLAILLVGGAYGVRHALKPASGNSGQIAREDQSKAPESSTEESSEGSTEGDDSKEESGTGSGSSSQHEATNGSETTESSAGASSQPTTQPLPTTGHSEEAPESLPQTGPVDMFLQFIFLGSLAAALVVYFRSFRQPASF